MGFVPPDIPKDAELLVVGQNPGKQEEAIGRPFVGATGSVLTNTYVPLTGVDTELVGKDNVIRCRWQPPGSKVKTNELPQGKMVEEAIEHCKIYDTVPSTVRLVICMGVLALHRFAVGLKQHEWRGHLLPMMEEVSA
jgi:DNA polymerase